jgi:hypothetical protein
VGAGGRNDPDFFPLFVGNYVLGGGGFDSQLMREVRDKRGYAYSAYSYFLPMEEAGPFQLGLQTKLEQTGDALKVAQVTLRQFIADGPSEAELPAKSNLRWVPCASTATENPRLPVGDRFRLPLITGHLGRGNAVDVAAVKQAFARRIDPDRLVTVVVGAGGAQARGPQRARRFNRVRIIGGQYRRRCWIFRAAQACAPRPTGCARPCSTGWGRICPAGIAWTCLPAAVRSVLKPPRAERNGW